ncbi:tRNA lysidine(34) synthetase TilS [Paucihalobacter ruber]|nr:tRNA lysidine(34) synthetase TilS [Paucihalobacter ruber]
MQSRLLLAVSGGLDSVALTHLCAQLQLNVAIAHCNFSLRSNESDSDEVFVIQLAESLNIEVFTQRFDTLNYAAQNKLSTQMAARELRYNWFQELATALNFDFILTAHHADDQLETFLINFLRGTGLDGLTGIPEINNNIVRPLLPFSREDIETYLKNANVLWREDSSNISTKYLRNKLRHEVVPVLKEINPQLLDSFKSTLSHLNDVADIVDESLNAVAKRAIVNIDDNGISYKVSEFKKVNNPHAYLYHMFKDFGFTAWDDILHLLNAQTGKQVFSETHVLLKNRDVLLLSELKDVVETKVYQITKVPEIIEFPHGKLDISEVEAVDDNSPTAMFIDGAKLQLPLELRKWQHGDYFYPVGMTGKKKVSKYLKDIKLSLVEKDQILVLCSEGDIVCILDYRLDRRFMANQQSSQIIKIELIS